jgi:hypothetical protein
MVLKEGPYAQGYLIPPASVADRKGMHLHDFSVTQPILPGLSNQTIRLQL